MSENTKGMTPYAAAKVVNAALTEAGLKEVPPQMLYNYTSARVNAGKEPFIKYDKKTNTVDEVDLQRWMKTYIEKRNAKLVAVEAE